MIWRKSSFSGTNGGCIEVAWRQSSFSSSGGNCVQVAQGSMGVLVRDSKNTTGPTLAFENRSWQAFLQTRLA